MAYLALLRFLACPLRLKLKFEQNGSVKWSTREGICSLSILVIWAGLCLRALLFEVVLIVCDDNLSCSGVGLRKGRFLPGMNSLSARVYPLALLRGLRIMFR